MCGIEGKRDSQAYEREAYTRGIHKDPKPPDIYLTERERESRPLLLVMHIKGETASCRRSERITVVVFCGGSPQWSIKNARPEGETTVFLFFSLFLNIDGWQISGLFLTKNKKIHAPDVIRGRTYVLQVPVEVANLFTYIVSEPPAATYIIVCNQSIPVIIVPLYRKSPTLQNNTLNCARGVYIIVAGATLSLRTGLSSTRRHWCLNTAAAEWKITPHFRHILVVFSSHQ